MREKTDAVSPDGLWRVEVRDTPGVDISTGAGDVPATELWLVNVKTRQATRLLRGKASDDIKKTLAGMAGPCFSRNGRTVFFVSAAWATSGAIQRLDIASRKVQFVVDGEDVAVVQRGPDRDLLLVDRAVIKNDKHGESLGRRLYTWLVTPQGRLVRELGTSDSKAVYAFRTRYL